jgi:hypothetical protein
MNDGLGHNSRVATTALTKPAATLSPNTVKEGVAFVMREIGQRRVELLCWQVEPNQLGNL